LILIVTPPTRRNLTPKRGPSQSPWAISCGLRDGLEARLRQ
jgi:hypothetical protein